MYTRPYSDIMDASMEKIRSLRVAYDKSYGNICIYTASLDALFRTISVHQKCVSVNFEMNMKLLQIFDQIKYILSAITPIDDELFYKLYKHSDNEKIIYWGWKSRMYNPPLNGVSAGEIMEEIISRLNKITQRKLATIPVSYIHFIREYYDTNFAHMDTFIPIPNLSVPLKRKQLELDTDIDAPINKKPKISDEVLLHKIAFNPHFTILNQYHCTRDIFEDIKNGKTSYHLIEILCWDSDQLKLTIKYYVTSNDTPIPIDFFRSEMMQVVEMNGIKYFIRKNDYDQYTSFLGDNVNKYIRFEIRKKDDTLFEIPVIMN